MPFIYWRGSLLDYQKKGKKVIFIDELPWMDTHKSNFVRSLDHFWNGWATTRRDIVLIICGSATSWIIDNVIMNYGGLHNRLTNHIFLEPFCLRECKQYCEWKGLGYTDNQVLEAYMALGGIPYYQNFLRKGESVAQNFDRMFFSERGELTHEFDALYASLFRSPKIHIAIIVALAKKKMGMLREDLLSTSKLQDNSIFSTALRELTALSSIMTLTSVLSECISKKVVILRQNSATPHHESLLFSHIICNFARKTEKQTRNKYYSRVKYVLKASLKRQLTR